MINFLQAPISHKRSNGIDFLRGVLVIWVTVAHLIPWAAYVSGQREENFFEVIMSWLIKIFQTNGETHPAVLGFIVLSGYCIHRNGARSNTDFNSLEYGLRRFFRIYPVYILATIVGVVFYFCSYEKISYMAVVLSGTAKIEFSCIAAKLTGISAFYPSLHLCVFQGNAPLITVMVETWLYVLYALVIVYLLKGGNEKKAMGLIGVMYCGVLGIVSMNPEFLGWWNNGSIFSFAVYWWIGAMFVRRKKLSRLTVITLSFIWLVLSVIFIFKIFNNLVLIEARKIIISCLFGSLIFYLDNKDHFLYSFGNQIGLASYSIYALHAPCLMMLLIYGFSPWMAIIVAILIGLLVYHFFEKPFIQFGKKITQKYF
jgi:peptidoglycan/LPS O-acetylase OafA/YrhL